MCSSTSYRSDDKYLYIHLGHYIQAYELSSLYRCHVYHLKLNGEAQIRLCDCLLCLVSFFENAQMFNGWNTTGHVH